MNIAKVVLTERPSVLEFSLKKFHEGQSYYSVLREVFKHYGNTTGTRQNKIIREDSLQEQVQEAHAEYNRRPKG